MIKTKKIDGVDHYDSILLSKRVLQTHKSLKDKFGQVGYTETAPADWFGNGYAIPKPVAIELLNRYDITKMQNGTKLSMQQMLDHLNGVEPKSAKEITELKTELNQLRNQLKSIKKTEPVDLTEMEAQLNQLNSRLNSVSKDLIENADGLDSMRADLIDSENSIKLNVANLTESVKSVKSKTLEIEGGLTGATTQLNQKLDELTGRFEMCIEEILKEKACVIVERDRLAAEAKQLSTWSYKNWRSWSFEGTLNRGGNFIAILFSSFLTVQLCYLLVAGVEAKLQADTIYAFSENKLDWNALALMMALVQITFVVINGNKRFFKVKIGNYEETHFSMMIASVVFFLFNFTMNLFRFLHKSTFDTLSTEWWFYIEISLVLSLAISVLGYVVSKRTVHSD